MKLYIYIYIYIWNLKRYVEIGRFRSTEQTEMVSEMAFISLVVGSNLNLSLKLLFCPTTNNM